MSLPEADPSETMRKWRRSERAQMIEVIRDLIEESRRRAKSKYTPSRERARWIRLAGQLIWYKDQILRSMTDEAVEEEVKQLEKEIEQLKEMAEKPPNQSFPRTMIETPPLRRKDGKRDPPQAQGRVNEYASTIVPSRNGRVSLSRSQGR